MVEMLTAPGVCNSAHDVRKLLRSNCAEYGSAASDTTCWTRRAALVEGDRGGSAFLNSLGWCRSEAHPVSACCSEAPRCEGDEAQYVTLDGGMRWLDSKPLTRHGEMFERRTMCEYAAFLFEATGENSAAEQILRTVQQKDRLHGCAIEVLGDLLESPGRRSTRSCSASPAWPCIDEHAFDGGDTAPAAGGVVDEWVVNVAP